MKRLIRILSIVLFFLISFILFTKSVRAADVGFPFDEFIKQGYSYNSVSEWDYDTMRSEVIFPQGLVSKTAIKFKGYKKGISSPIYTQVAYASLSAPSGFTDNLGYITYLNTALDIKNYGDDQFKEEVEVIVDEESYGFTNKASYYVYHDIGTILHKKDNDTTVEESIQAQIDVDRNNDYYENNYDKVEVIKGGNYQALVCKTDTPYSQTDTEDSAGNSIYDEKNKKVYGFNCSEGYKYLYTIYYAVPELNDYYYEVVLFVEGSYSANIEDKSQGDYQKVIDNYKSIVLNHKNADYPSKFLNLSSLYRIIWEEAVVTSDYTGKIGAGTTQNAEENPGEDSGVSVPVAIVIGLAAAGAALVGASGLAGAAGASNSSSNASDEDKKKRAYKMYVQKDFGDSIKKGAKEPSIIRARMTEIDELGKEHERNDLTAKISVSGEDMVIQNVAMSGKYIEAKVSVPKDTTRDRAKITFTFTDEGGTFDNTVIFKLVDGPHIEFISVGEEEGTHNENCGINAILGDSFTYEARFMTVDVTTPPTINDIKAKNPSEFDVKFEETSEHLVYKMILKNNTKALDKKDVFAKVKEERFEISVNVKDEDKPLQGFVVVSLYPEGITVDSTERGKKNEVEYIGIKSYEKEEVGELDSNWQPTTIKFSLAIIGKDKIIIDPKEAKYEFEKIKGAGGLGTKADIEQAIAEKYKYKDSKDNNYAKFEYIFEPNTMLWDPEDGSFFMVLLPVTAEYQEYSYKEEIPLRICGKKVDEVEEWNREYEKVRNRIERFSVPGEKDRNLKKLKEFAIADQYKASVLELRLMSKDILRSYMKYWTHEHEKDEYDMRVLEWQVFGLECAKWIGDCAFSFLVSAYAGPLADAIISPAKDFATGAIGELYAAWKYGEKIDINIIERFEFTKSLASAGDNIVGNAIDITSWRKAAATLGGYFVYASIKAYIEKLNEGESDLYGAFVKGFADMTLQTFKAAFSNLFKKWIETSKYFQDTIGPKIQKYVTDTTIENFQLKYNYSQQLYGELALKGAKEVEIKVTEALNSVISNLVGPGAGYIVDKTLENVHTSSGFSVKNNHLIFTFTMQAFQSRTYEVTLDINSILMNVSCPLFGWLYDMIFGSVPVSAKTIDVPKDPPLPNKD